MPHFPLSSAHLIGWVLRRQRLRFQACQGVGSRAFFGALREQGIKVDASRISRWELGRLAPSARVLAGYEHVCGLPEFTVRALATEAYRVSGLYDVNVVDAGTAHGVAHEVLDMTLAGMDPPSGELFGAIEQAFLQDSSRYLSPLMAERVARILVSRLDITRSHDRITNRAAVASAARHPRLHGALVQELVDRASQPHVGAVSEALELLLRLDAEQAVPVLRSLLSPDADPDLRSVVECHVRHALMTNALGSSSRQQLKASLRELEPVEVATPSVTGQLLPRGTVHAVLNRHLDQADDLALLDDERSAALLDTALRPGDMRHQHLASLGLISGDVSRGLAPALVELAACSDGTLARRAAVLLSYLPQPPAAVVEQAVPLVADPVVARQLWRSRGHADVPLEHGPVVEAGLDDLQVASTVVYALGMSGSTDLEPIASDARRPVDVVGRSKWWLEHGPGQVV